jgi:hypothetical protein
MKKLLFFILIIGFPQVISLSLIKPASAYCVENSTKFTVTARDGRWVPVVTKYFNKDLNPGQRDCCPGDYGECQGATIYAEPKGISIVGTAFACKANVGPRDVVVITAKKDGQLICRVRK